MPIKALLSLENVLQAARCPDPKVDTGGGCDVRRQYLEAARLTSSHHSFVWLTSRQLILETLACATAPRLHHPLEQAASEFKTGIPWTPSLAHHTI